ncbi:MAG: ATP-dependent Clp protease adaptor ClpS [Bacteroidota bacterium]
MVTKKQQKPDINIEKLNLRLYQLWLFNDDVNSFDDVIESLIEVCNHDPLQAEQCAFIADAKGKCSIKNGTITELEVLMVALSDRGLTVQIK